MWLLLGFHRQLCKSTALYSHAYFNWYRPENPSPIVVYGNGTPECTAHINWLASKLEQLQKDRKVLAKISEDASDSGNDYECDDPNEDKPFDYFQHFCHTIADRAKEIWILDDGYEAFREEYPFLCGHVDWNNLFPLPHQVSRNLFLGTRVFPLTKDCLEKLGITHIIVSQFQKIDWTELDGISVLCCSVKDENDQEMLPCWKACYQFITEALGVSQVEEKSSAKSQNLARAVSSDSEIVPRTVASDKSHLPNLATLKICTSTSCHPTSDYPTVTNSETSRGAAVTTEMDPQQHITQAGEISAATATTTTDHGVRILVMLHGRSRLSSVILAYLIKAYRMNFGQAWTHLSSKCWHIIDQSLVYVDQLKQWEQTELASIEGF